MARGKLDRIEKELGELRKRRSSTDWHSDATDAGDRLGKLLELLAEYSDEVEIRRHAVVSSVAALQSFHRGILTEAMERSEAVTLRASELVGEKYSLKETLDYIGAGRLSAHELIAHLAPANNVDDLMTWMGRVFDTDFKALLGQAVPPFSRDRVGDERVARIVEDVPSLLASLGELFRLRHILAHEAAPNLEVSHDYALRLVVAARTWMDAVQGALWMTLWRDVPLKQMEMNLAAFASVEAARSGLAQAMKSLRVHLRGEKRRALASNHRAWISLSRDLVARAYTRDGSMWRSVAASVTASMLVERAAHIRGWADVYNPL